MQTGETEAKSWAAAGPALLPSLDGVRLHSGYLEAIHSGLVAGKRVGFMVDTECGDAKFFSHGSEDWVKRSTDYRFGT